MEREDIVVALIAAAPGHQLISRVRLQKTAYLLEQLGLGRGLPFEYHHYGPYSRELDNAVGDAEAFELVREDFDHRKSDGAMYSVFKLVPGQSAKDEAYGELGRQRVSELIGRFASTNVTVLELAATVDWLWRYESVADWRAEVTKRKGRKVQGGRLEKAVDLLCSLGLQPPSSVDHPDFSWGKGRSN